MRDVPLLAPAEIETEGETQVTIVARPDLDFLIAQFKQVIESGIRLINPQTPGDWIQRPDYLFDILFGDLLAITYPLGGCSPDFDADGVLISVSCVGAAQGSDISPFVADNMADLP